MRLLHIGVLLRTSSAPLRYALYTLNSPQQCNPPTTTYHKVIKMFSGLIQNCLHHFVDTLLGNKHSTPHNHLPSRPM